MSQASPQMRDFAKRLTAHESKGNKSSQSKARVAFQVCEKLRPHIATLMGNAGFQGLLARALALASREAPALRALHVKADGSLAGLDELEAQARPVDLAEEGVVLLTQLLGLLAAFIGESLTLRMVLQAHPKLPFNDLDDQRLAK